VHCYRIHHVGFKCADLHNWKLTRKLADHQQLSHYSSAGLRLYVYSYKLISTVVRDIDARSDYFILCVYARLPTSRDLLNSSTEYSG
jgi:hypothetical protein